jgi:hypothetical protein
MPFNDVRLNRPSQVLCFKFVAFRAGSCSRRVDAEDSTIAAEIQNIKAAAVILDPLLSRLDAALDSHKDAEVRLALEPLVSLAERTDVSIPDERLPVRAHDSQCSFRAPLHRLR